MCRCAVDVKKDVILPDPRIIPWKPKIIYIASPINELNKFVYRTAMTK